MAADWGGYSISAMLTISRAGTMIEARQRPFSALTYRQRNSVSTEVLAHYGPPAESRQGGTRSLSDFGDFLHKNSPCW